MADQEEDFSNYSMPSSSNSSSDTEDFSAHSAPKEEYSSANLNIPSDSKHISTALIGNLASKFPGPLKYLPHLAAGLANSAKNVGKMLPDLSSLAPESFQKIIPYKSSERPIEKFDPYAAFGVQDQSIVTPEGLAQTIGEFGGPESVYNLGKTGFNLISKGIPKAFNYAKKSITPITDYVSPAKLSKKITQDLGRGANNTEQISKSLATDIRNAHDSRNAEASAYFDYPLKQAGNEKIYTKPNPLISTEMDKSKNILNKVEDLDIGSLYDAFKQNQNFQNAHNLQSELGVMIRDLEKNPGLTIQEVKNIQHLKNVRDTLKGDIQDFLKNHDMNSNENLSPIYQKGSDLYRENVAPYLATKKLRQITRGRKSSVPNIHNIFENPDQHDIINRATGETEIGHVNKILQDLPQESRGKILANKIGGSLYEDEPEKLSNALKNAEKKGYSKYFNQDLNRDLGEMLNREKMKKIAKIALPTGTALLGIEELMRRYK